MKKYKVIVTDDRFGTYEEERAVLEEIGADLVVHDCMNDDELIAAARGADGIIVNLYPMNSQVMQRLNGCRIISRYGVGYDNVNVEAATNAGIWVSIVPDYGVEEVSDHVLALLLGLVRNIPFVHREIKNGKWNLQNQITVPRLTGKVLGIIGYGRIGRSLHRKVSGFGFSRVLVTDPYVTPGEIRAHGGEPVSMEVLLKTADFISIHVCLNRETKHMIGAKELQLMKSAAIIINTARGGIIDENALCNALKSRQITAAGLDVFETEPIKEKSILFELENVLLTSHMAYYSEESIVELKTKAARNVAEVLKGNKPLYPINNITR